MLSFVFAVTIEKSGFFYNGSSTFFSSFLEDIMGTTLHNKIYLGRTSVLSSKRIQAALLVGVFVSIGLAWMALRLIK